MEEESRSGKMELNMMENGLKERLTVKEYSIMSMEISMRVNLITIKQMAKVRIIIKMGLSILDLGKMT